MATKTEENDKILFSQSNLHFAFSGVIYKFLQWPGEHKLPKETTNTSKPSPEVIGTPPPLVSHPDPVNDTGLVSQYIRSIFQDSKGNFWFGPAGQSVARYDVKTLKYFSKIEFFHGNNSVDPRLW